MRTYYLRGENIKMMKKWLSITLIATLSMTLMAGCTKTEEVTAQAVEENQPVDETEVAVEEDGIFISVASLQNAMASDDIILLDARGKDAYDGGHIADALAISWQELSSMSADFATPTWGSVVDPIALGETLGGLGIDGSKPVVIYADTEKGWGEDGRVYWTLKMAGIEDVRMLDGGINVWNDASAGLTTEASEATPVDFEIQALDKAHTITTAELSANYMDYKVIDTRDLDEYEGAVKFGEARGGHLPGAIHLAYKSLLEKDGQLKSDEELVQLFEAAGLKKEDKIATYCTAGIRSAHVAVILENLGYENVVNYDESFYVWANDPSLKLGTVVKGDAYNFYTQDHLKQAIENNEDMLLVDIQVADEYAAHHIVGAVETNAYPVKTDEEKALLAGVIQQAKTEENPVVIVCPRGGGGAQRTYKHMVAEGMNPAQLYILEKGQEGWPYAALLETNE